MNPEIEKVIEDRLNKLPSNIVAAIKSVPWREKIREIAKANNLSAEQTELFEIETSLVVLGIETPSKYPDNLAQNVELSDEQVIKIAKEVDIKIMAPIFENSKKPGVSTKSSVPEIAPEIHPMVGMQPARQDLAGKTRPSSEPVLILNKDGAKQVMSGPTPAVNPATSSGISEQKISLPDYRYDSGGDPYREPLK